MECRANRRRRCVEDSGEAAVAVPEAGVAGRLADSDTLEVATGL